MRRSRPLLSKILILVAILLVVGVTVSGCGIRAEPKGWSGVLVTEDSVFVAAIGGNLVGLDKSEGALRWDTILESADTKIAIYGTPVMSEGLLYVGGYKVKENKGRVYAVSADAGRPEWEYPSRGDLDEPIVGGVAVSQGAIYFGSSDGKVYAIDALTGSENWEFETGDKIWSTPVIDGETIYVSSFDKKIYALDINTGMERWRFDEAEGAFVATPLLYQDTIYIGSFDRRVYAVNAADGSLKWRSEIEAEKWFWAKPVAHNGVIYAPSVDGQVYLLDAETGREIAAAIDLGSPISSGPVIVADQVIVASQEGRVYALDTSTNRANRSPILTVDDKEEIFAPLAASDGVVYVHARTSKEDTLYAVKVETRETVWDPVLLVPSD